MPDGVFVLYEILNYFSINVCELQIVSWKEQKTIVK